MGGASIATTAAGKPAWHVGRSPSPRVAAGGEWGSFTVELAPEGGVKNALPTVHGSIDVVCSTGVSEKSAPLAVAPGTTVSLGGLSFKSSKAQNFFGGGESFGIDVAGDLTKLASIEIVDGGKTVKSNGRMQMAAVTYLFPTPSSDTVTLIPLLVLAAAPARAEDPATRSPAVETTHADAASADSPLASALENVDWLPLVVESVSIDTTAPRELRKNWVVSFSGGIKARVHSPAKTFGLSTDELPGKRFGIRFSDRHAAVVALRGAIYSGELEVRALVPVSAMDSIREILSEESQKGLEYSDGYWDGDAPSRLKALLGEPFGRFENSAMGTNWVSESWWLEDGTSFSCLEDSDRIESPAFYLHFADATILAPERKRAREWEPRPLPDGRYPCVPMLEGRALPRSKAGYRVSRIYDVSSDRIFYLLSPDFNRGRSLAEVLVCDIRLDSLADAIGFVDENAGTNTPLVFLKTDYLSSDWEGMPTGSIFDDRLVSSLFVHVLTQDDWNELQTARRNGTVEAFAKKPRVGRAETDRMCDFLLETERQELTALLRNPPETLTPSCRTRIEKFLWTYAPEPNPAPASHADSAEGAKEPAP